jgi:hypothetical protein
MILGRAVLALTLAVILGYGTTAQEASAVQVTATAEVVTTIDVSQDQALDFGAFAQSATPFDVVMGFDGARTVNAVASAGGQQGIFSVTGGLTTATYSVQLPTLDTTNPVPLYSPGPTDGGSDPSMNMHTFTTDWQASWMPTGAEATFQVGATLSVGASQTVGNYSGYYNVTVSQP